MIRLASEIKAIMNFVGYIGHWLTPGQYATGRGRTKFLNCRIGFAQARGLQVISSTPVTAPAALQYSPQCDALHPTSSADVLPLVIHADQARKCKQRLFRQRRRCETLLGFLRPSRASEASEVYSLATPLLKTARSAMRDPS